MPAHWDSGTRSARMTTMHAAVQLVTSSDKPSKSDAPGSVTSRFLVPSIERPSIEGRATFSAKKQKE